MVGSEVWMESLCVTLAVRVKPPAGWRLFLDVSGEVERVALEFGEGDRRMLQVVEQHLDLEKEKGSNCRP